MIRERNKSIIKETIIKFGFPENLDYSEELYELEKIPKTKTLKLMFLILTYHRECPEYVLRDLSTQPAGTIRLLRDMGFIFKFNPKNPSRFQYRNEFGEMCRKIESYSPYIEKIQGLSRFVYLKSINAAISAIEIYNKPDFKYREELFSILIVNAWELLMKAKILSENNNKISSIYVGDKGSFKKNRSGNNVTISIVQAMDKLRNNKKIDQICCDNINILIEIRDNSIHFVNIDSRLAKKILEVGAATLRNYVTMVHKWFNDDLSNYNFYLMPLSFFNIKEIDQHAFLNNKNIDRLLSYIASTEMQHNENSINDEFSVVLNYEVKFKRVGISDYTINASKGEGGIKVYLREDEISSMFPLEYNQLILLLRSRYTNFKTNNEFYRIKSLIEAEGKYCHTRYLNTKKKTNGMKFYSKDIVEEFDKYYQRQEK